MSAETTGSFLPALIIDKLPINAEISFACGAFFKAFITKGAVIPAALLAFLKTILTNIVCTTNTMIKHY